MIPTPTLTKADRMFVPTPPPPSHEARELAGYLQQVIDAYERDHPNLNANDVRQALRLTRTARGPNSPALVAAVLAVVVLGGFVAIASTRTDGNTTWVLLGAMILVVVLAVVKHRR